MNYRDRGDGGIGPKASAGGEMAGWTFEAVEQRWIEAMRCWRRMPGGGRWPFAGDGPWNLILKDWWHYGARDPERPRRLPLGREQIAAMEEATEWLGLVPDGDRRLVVLVLGQKLRGAREVDWPAIRSKLSAEISRKGLYRRYRRAVARVANTLNERGLPVSL
ncbi:MAG: hypothetical protein AB7O91_04025 [Sphingomonas sp.]